MLTRSAWNIKMKISNLVLGYFLFASLLELDRNWALLLLMEVLTDYNSTVTIRIALTVWWIHTFLFWRAGRLKLLVFHFDRNFVVLHPAEEGTPGAGTQSRATNREVSLDLQTGFKHKIVKHVIMHTEAHIEVYTQMRRSDLLLASMSRSRGYNSVADNCSFTFPMSLWWT